MKKIVVLGAAESGVGAAILAKKEGFEVFVSDMGAIKDHYKKMLDDHGIEWEEGHHTEEKILDADEVIKSPGIPDEAPMIQIIIAKGIHIISEIEFAGRYTHSKMICITGSNGKTTTTSLIYHIFKAAGYDAGLAGNIGRSLALQVAEDPHEYYIIEHWQETSVGRWLCRWPRIRTNTISSSFLRSNSITCMTSAPTWPCS